MINRKYRTIRQYNFNKSKKSTENMRKITRVKIVKKITVDFGTDSIEFTSQLSHDGNFEGDFEEVNTNVSEQERFIWDLNQEFEDYSQENPEFPKIFRSYGSLSTSRSLYSWGAKFDKSIYVGPSLSDEGDVR